MEPQPFPVARALPLTRNQWVCLGLIFALALGCRLYKLDNSILDWPAMRQGHSSLVARNYARHGMHILQPDISMNGREPALWYNEFSLYEYLVAAVYQVTGENTSVARLLNIFFSLACMVQLFRLTRRYLGDDAAMFAILFFAVTPLAIYYGRTVQRQQMVLFLGLTMLDEFDRWLLRSQDPGIPQRRASVHLALALFSGMLAILANPPIAHLGLPMIYLTLARTRLRTLFQSPTQRAAATGPLIHWPTELPRLAFITGFAALMLLPTIVWYKYSMTQPTSWSLQPSGREDFRDFTKLEYYFVWFTPHFFKMVAWTFWSAVLTPLGAIITAGSVILLWKRIPALFHVWLLALFIYFCLDVFPIAIAIHAYYYLNAVPLACVYVGVGLAVVWNLFSGKSVAASMRPSIANTDREPLIPRRITPPMKAMRGVVIASLLVITVKGFEYNKIFYRIHEVLQEYPEAAQAVLEHSSAEDLVLLDSFDPAPFYEMHRDGWGLNAWDWNVNYLEDVRSKGCRYLALAEYEKAAEREGVADYLAKNTDPVVDNERIRLLKFKD